MAIKKDPMRAALTAFRTSKSADLKLEGNHFYRRTVPSKSASYHGTYTDLYDNADDYHTITGGMSPRYSQFDTTFTDKPPFGAGELSGLYFSAKIKNDDFTNPTSGVTSGGEGVGIKAFKIDSKIDVEGGASDGSTMIVNEDILAFSTYFTTEPPSQYYNEIFDGVGEETTTTVEQGQLVVQKEAYLTLNDAHKNCYQWGKKESKLFRRKLKKSDYKKHFGETHNGEDIVKIYRSRSKGGYALTGKFGFPGFKGGSARFVTQESKSGLTGKTQRGAFKLKGDKRKLVKYLDRNTIPTTDGPYKVTRSNVVTPNNSTLLDVKEARTMSELSSSGGTKEIAWGRVSFSSENAHEGGQSVKMHTFWPAMTNQDGWRRSSIYYPADSTSSHTHQRQECYIVKKIPVPKRWQNQTNPSDADKIGTVVTAKLNLKKIAPCESRYFKRDNTFGHMPHDLDDDGEVETVYSDKYDVTLTHTDGLVANDHAANQVTLSRIFTRGIAICFSEYPPGMHTGTTIDSTSTTAGTKSQDDTFYTFLKRHHPNMEDTVPLNRDNNSKDFYGVFLANDHGVITINRLGAAATSAGSDGTSYLSWLSCPVGDKVGIATTPTDFKYMADDADLSDKWLDFNFVIDPNSQGCNLVITDAEDGKALYRVAISNSTSLSGSTADNLAGNFPRFMSIWNVNTGNPNSGIGANDKDHGPFADETEAVRNKYKGFMDTGMVFESCVDVDDLSSHPSTPRRKTIFTATAGVQANIIFSDRRTGATDGNLEKYWAFPVGSEGYIATSQDAGSLLYCYSATGEQNVNQSMYDRMSFSAEGQTVNQGEPLLTSASVPVDGGIAPGVDAETIIYIDSIKCHNISPEIENATIVNANNHAGDLTIPATHKTFDVSYSNVADWNGADDIGPAQKEAWSYLSFGFNNEDDFEGAVKFFLLSGFATKNPLITTSIMQSTNSDNSYLRGGYTGAITGGAETLGGFTGTATFDNDEGGPSDGSDTTGRGFVFNASGEGAEVGTKVETANYIDGFSQKGVFTLNFTKRTDKNVASRENPYVSARVELIQGGNFQEAVVDNADIFNLNPNEEYILYRDGSDYSNTKYLTGLKVVEKDDDVITFNKSLKNADSGATIISDMGNLYISPKRFWIIFAILNKSDANTYLPERSYDSIVGISGVETPGATFNEYKFTDSSYYKYQRNMEPFADVESNDVRLDVDMGFGVVDEDNTEAGMAGILHLETSADLDGADIDNQRIDISGIIDEMKPEYNSTLPILLTPLSATNESIIEIYAEEASNEYDKPYLLAEFRDEIPVIEDFTVEPNQENPFFPHYRWESPDDDLWYGFLSIDTKQIYNQYDNAVIHLPMNEESRHAKTPASAPVEKIQGTSNVISGALKNVEGLSGYCLEFDGNDDYVTINHGAGSDPTADCTKEMTVLIHIIADSASDERYVISQTTAGNPDEKFLIKINSSNQVEATVFYDASGNYVSLKSASIIATDGQTPTAIMLVVDSELDSGNAKLYINGNLEDLTGQATTTGSTDNWKVGQSINGGNSTILVGNSAVGATNGFDGKIEELVIYKKALYPFNGKTTDLVVRKPFVELDDSSSSASLPIVSKIFIKDYHNIRGKTSEQVATAPAVTYRKAAFRMDNS